MAEIDAKALNHLFELARIEPEQDAEKRKKLLSDIRGILDHFAELNEVDTSHAEPLSGGGFLSDVSREDVSPDAEWSHVLLTEQFSEHENGYLKVPPVFEQE